MLGGVPFLPGIPTLLQQALSPRQTEDEDAAEPPLPAAGEERASPRAPPDLRRRSATYPGARSEDGDAAAAAEAAEAAQLDELALDGDTTLPAPLQPGNHGLPEMSESSRWVEEC